jgi:hypothetical protein
VAKKTAFQCLYQPSQRGDSTSSHSTRRYSYPMKNVEGERNDHVKLIYDMNAGE